MCHPYTYRYFLKIVKSYSIRNTASIKTHKVLLILLLTCKTEEKKRRKQNLICIQKAEICYCNYDFFFKQSKQTNVIFS